MYTKHVSLGLFLVAVSKGLVLGFSPVDLGVCSLLGAISFLCDYFTSQSKLRELDKQYLECKEELAKLTKSIEATNTHVSSLKLATQMRPSVVGR